MYYILNYTNNTFTACVTTEDTIAAVNRLKDSGVDISTFVAVVVDSDDGRLTGAEFIVSEAEYDDEFINERNDVIDEAVWDAISSLGTKRAHHAILDAMHSLCANELAQSYVTTHQKKLTKPIEAEINKMLENEELRELVENGETDMEYIGELTDFIQGILDKEGVATCHPFYTEDNDWKQNPCYKCERCAVCGHCDEEAE